MPHVSLSTSRSSVWNAARSSHLRDITGAVNPPCCACSPFWKSQVPGSLRYFGDISDPRREITLLLQSPYLVKESVFRNVTLGLRLRGRRDGLARAYADAMQAVGFTQPDILAARRRDALSGGECQRVALAARLALKPAVLLLDEPTSNVDAASAHAIVTAVRRSLSAGTSVVCATHDRVLLDALNAREVNLAGDLHALS